LLRESLEKRCVYNCNICKIELRGYIRITPSLTARLRQFGISITSVIP